MFKITGRLVLTGGLIGIGIQHVRKYILESQSPELLQKIKNIPRDILWYSDYQCVLNFQKASYAHRSSKKWQRSKWPDHRYLSVFCSCVLQEKQSIKLRNKSPSSDQGSNIYIQGKKDMMEWLLAFTFTASLSWVSAVVRLSNTINMSQNYSEIVQWQKFFLWYEEIQHHCKRA